MFGDLSLQGITKGPREPKAPRRPVKFWAPLNEWWRSYLSTSDKKPHTAEVQIWYNENAHVVWSELERPTWKETRIHAKCLRSTEQVKNYFRDYRARRQHKDCGSGSSNGVPLLLSSSRLNIATLKSKHHIGELPQQLAQDFSSTVILQNDLVVGLSSGASSHPDSPPTASALQYSTCDILQHKKQTCSPNINPSSPSGARAPTHAVLITSGDTTHQAGPLALSSASRMNKKSGDTLNCPSSSMRAMYEAAKYFQEGKFQSHPSEGAHGEASSAMQIKLEAGNLQYLDTQSKRRNTTGQIPPVVHPKLPQSSCSNLHFNASLFQHRPSLRRASTPPFLGGVQPQPLLSTSGTLHHDQHPRLKLYVKQEENDRHWGSPMGENSTTAQRIFEAGGLEEPTMHALNLSSSPDIVTEDVTMGYPVVDPRGRPLRQDTHSLSPLYRSSPALSTHEVRHHSFTSTSCTFQSSRYGTSMPTRLSRFSHATEEGGHVLGNDFFSSERQYIQDQVHLHNDTVHRRSEISLTSDAPWDSYSLHLQTNTQHVHNHIQQFQEQDQKQLRPKSAFASLRTEGHQLNKEDEEVLDSPFLSEQMATRFLPPQTFFGQPVTSGHIRERPAMRAMLSLPAIPAGVKSAPMHVHGGGSVQLPLNSLTSDALQEQQWMRSSQRSSDLQPHCSSTSEHRKREGEEHLAPHLEQLRVNSQALSFSSQNMNRHGSATGQQGHMEYRGTGTRSQEAAPFSTEHQLWEPHLQDLAPVTLLPCRASTEREHLPSRAQQLYVNKDDEVLDILNWFPQHDCTAFGSQSSVPSAVAPGASSSSTHTTTSESSSNPQAGLQQQCPRRDQGKAPAMPRTNDLYLGHEHQATSAYPPYTSDSRPPKLCLEADGHSNNDRYMSETADVDLQSPDMALMSSELLSGLGWEVDGHGITPPWMMLGVSGTAESPR
ncbi:hypothetical protein CEUSTIGMA_g314.t1 [Chlamydomonas eustigma]|uniref:Uncharacterized protein n=1 Tax=Chlamydomonas eustigma TaxID=1157962 RepID=A0A250WQ90_9CHLO|nr:hypothetical protein CEUSTIGMA_g314.t1 [Chlamydomonas eustigma]|eukprot:GAX72859.1 hypothetical protein CEUSTIGMA_g314.t1 [Chlamydomonas eustigma]